MSTKTFKTLENVELQAINGGIHLQHTVIGGGSYSYVMVSNPWDWLTDAAGAFVQRNKRK